MLKRVRSAAATAVESGIAALAAIPLPPEGEAIYLGEDVQRLP
jgi:hypothetical protein